MVGLVSGSFFSSAISKPSPYSFVKYISAMILDTSSPVGCPVLDNIFVVAKIMP
jgi:hypothetical protein